MTEKPIIFSAPMVRAILEGRKTQTRRIVKPQPNDFVHALKFELHPFAPSTFAGTPAEGIKVAPEKNVWVAEDWCQNIIGVYGDCPHGQPGDRLWVKETFRLSTHNDCACYDYCNCKVGVPIYRATYGVDDGDKWKPSIFMPRSAARLTLEITNVRVERLQEISEDDAEAEGSYLNRCKCPQMQAKPRNGMEAMFRQTGCTIHGDVFWLLWDSINAKRGFGWEKNPWVWVITFRVIGALLEHNYYDLATNLPRRMARQSGKQVGNESLPGSPSRKARPGGSL